MHRKITKKILRNKKRKNLVKGIEKTKSKSKKYNKNHLKIKSHNSN
jgi:hypothetical protein